MKTVREQFLFQVITTLVGQLGGAAAALLARDHARDVISRAGDPTPEDFAELERRSDDHLARVRAAIAGKGGVPTP